MEYVHGLSTTRSCNPSREFDRNTNNVSSKGEGREARNTDNVKPRQEPGLVRVDLFEGDENPSRTSKKGGKLDRDKSRNATSDVDGEVSISSSNSNTSGDDDESSESKNSSSSSSGSSNSSSISSSSGSSRSSSSSNSNSSSSSSSSSSNSGDGGSGSGSSSPSSGGSDDKDKKKKKKKKKKPRNWIDKIMKSSADEQKLLKAALWFPVGVAISALLYYLIWQKLNIEPKAKVLIGGGLALAISLTFALSITMRCVLCLVIPSFLGKAGRSYIAAFAIIYLISGPITNIIDNAKEVVRSLSCNSELLANHSKEKWKLRLHPIEGAVGDITKDEFILQRIANAIEKAFWPLKKEIHKDEEEEEEMEKEIKKVEKLTKSSEKKVDKVEKHHIKDKDTADKAQRREKEWEKKLELRCEDTYSKAQRREKEWEKKLELRCEDTYSKGVVRCREKMGELESKCKDALSLIGHILCLPLKITLFCQIVKLLPGAFGMSCDKMDVIPPGFGQTFTDADDVIDDMDQGMKVKMQYQMVGSDQPDLDYTPVLELRHSAMDQVDRKARFMHTLMSLIKSILAFTFLKVFKAAFHYNSQYLNELTFDNIYITTYFRHIDARRRKQDRRTLLPLKKKERVDTISPTKVGLTKKEKKSMSKGTGLLVFRLIITAIIVYMDGLIYQILDIIARNGHVEYRQEGEHTVDIKVYGKGFMSGLVHTFLTKFNSHHKLNKVTTNQECLPVPSKTDPVLLGFLFGAYVMVWIFMYGQAYGLRFRRVIAAFFYRKREKKRVLYLYNKMFRTRVGYLKHMKKKIKKQIKEREFKVKVGAMAALQNTFPRLCGCLRYLKKVKRTCILCEDKESPSFYHCPTAGCGVSYCKDCWRDIKKKCLSCRLRAEDDSDDDGTTESSDEGDSDTDSD